MYKFSIAELEVESEDNYLVFMNGLERFERLFNMWK